MQTQPVEDIDAVLGRFQAWAGSRNAIEVEPGIRELSYEEALHSSRYRWKGSDRPPAKKADPKLESERTAPVPAPAVTPKVQERAKTASGVCNVKRRTGQVREKHPAAKAALSAKAQAKAEFREVLADTVFPPEGMVTARPAELSRQVVISLRFTAAERALIKTRAAETGISASAYIRQCALEVEQLRAQVQQAIAAMESKTPPQPQPAQPAPGLFARLAARFFSRRTQALALRA
jgi:hypothetical protein